MGWSPHLSLGLGRLLLAAAGTAVACDAPSLPPAPAPVLAASALTAGTPAALFGSDLAAQDGFGAAVAVTGQTAVVGAAGADVGGQADAGAAYVFVKTDAGWTQQQKLVAGDPAMAAALGTRVAVSGDTAAVAAPAAGAGAVYVFVRTGDVWTQQQKITLQGGQAGDQFGASLALSFDTLVVGAPGVSATQGEAQPITQVGAVYVLTRSGETWTQREALMPAQRTAGLRLGTSVALAEDRIAAGAPGYSPDAGSAGAGGVVVFERPAGGSFAEKQTLSAQAPTAGAALGSSVAWTGGRVLAGTPGDAPSGIAGGGAVYAFGRASAQAPYTQQQLLVSQSPAMNGRYGDTGSLAAGADAALVGAAGESTGGTAYLYLSDSGGGLSRRVGLVPAAPIAADRFGGAVAVTGAFAIVGAPGVDTRAANAGAAYLYAFLRDRGEPCAFAASCATGFCVDGVCCESACGAGLPDCQACSVLAGAATDGTCGVVKAGQVCRPVADSCDVAESCDGTALTCPADQRAVLLSCLNKADIYVALTASPEEARAIDTMTSEIRVSNSGPSAATQISLRVPMPAGAVVASIAGEGWVCTPEDKSATIACVRAQIAAGETAQLLVTFSPPEGSEQFDLSASATTGSMDADLTNNQATLRVFNRQPVFQSFSGGGSGCALVRGASRGAGGTAPLGLAALTLLGLGAGIVGRARRRRA